MGENARVKRRFHLTFPEHLAGEPIMFTVGERFGLVPNLRRASIEEGSAWAILELEGDEEPIGSAVAWLTEQGVTVDRLDEDE